MPVIFRPGPSHQLVHVLRATTIVLAAAALASCSQGPARVNQPYIDADDAGEAAMEMYDTNVDGVVRDAELEKAPGLRAMLATADSDKDGGLSADEVAARIEVWKQMRIGLTSFGFTATLDGRPLEGAIVTFVPEEFLGDDVKPASCQTSSFGGGTATIAKEDRPDPNTTPPGMQLGVYQVKISKLVGGKEIIPARYNAQTTLGQELAPDVREILNNRVVFELTTK